MDDLILDWCERLKSLPLEKQVEALNSARVQMHQAGPFAREPVDCVLWVHTENIEANDYNPNSVAPPEMQLLRVSITEDGYTQPIVSWRRDDVHEVVDGFHRNRVGRECPEVRSRIHGYLPLTIINTERQDRSDRIASTIRHNRARGKHAVSAMSDIVVELKRRNWSDERISRELGMDQDEILRLCQITGLAEMFTDQEFSKSWDVEGAVTESDFREITDDINTYGEETENWRTVNTSDKGRVFHTYEKWECHQAGFYATSKEGMSKAECEEAMRDLLVDIPAFKDALDRVVAEWKHSCEHYLTNAAMNRIAWLGQAATCIVLGIPAAHRGGFYLLTADQQDRANAAALAALNKWLAANGREVVDMDTAAPDREMEIY
jgi:hypothetical protein